MSDAPKGGFREAAQGSRPTARAFGFAATFYPTAVILIIGAVRAL
jgi:hypothetical protein